MICFTWEENIWFGERAKQSTSAGVAIAEVGSWLTGTRPSHHKLRALPTDLALSPIVCHLLIRKRPPPGIGGDQSRVAAAFHRMRSDPVLIAILVVSAATEAAMYAFVIEWTPVLTIDGVGPPHGIVFSCFMVRHR